MGKMKPGTKKDFLKFIKDFGIYPWDRWLVVVSGSDCRGNGVVVIILSEQHKITAIQDIHLIEHDKNFGWVGLKEKIDRERKKISASAPKILSVVEVARLRKKGYIVYSLEN